MENKEKSIEITLNAHGFSFKKTNTHPHPLTEEQKHNLVMALLAVILFGFCVTLIWIATTLCDFPGFLISLVGVAVLFAVVLFKLDY